MFYILASIDTLTGREEIVCEFLNSQKMRRFAADVMSGSKALPVWRKISDTHPHSGEATLVRTREFVNGNKVVTMQVVKPIAGREENHEYEPSNFEPVAEIKNAGYGMWVCPADDAPEGAVIGARYPVKRDESDQRRYVTLRVAEGETPERRHYLDAERAGAYAGLGSYSDDENDDIEFDEDEF